MRPSKSKPSPCKVWFQSGQRWKLIIEQLRFHTLRQKSLYLEVLLSLPWALSAPSVSHCWLAAGGPDREKPVALCASHMLTTHRPLTLLADPHPLPPVPKPRQFIPVMATIQEPTLPLFPQVSALGHHWHSHSYLFLCNSPRTNSRSAILLFWKWICILHIFQKYILFFCILSLLPTTYFFRSLAAEKLRFGRLSRPRRGVSVCGDVTADNDQMGLPITVIITM